MTRLKVILTLCILFSSESGWANCDHRETARLAFARLPLDVQNHAIREFRERGRVILPQKSIFTDDIAIAAEIDTAIRQKTSRGASAFSITNRFNPGSAVRSITLSSESTAELEQFILTVWGLFLTARPAEFQRSKVKSFQAAQSFCTGCTDHGALVHVDTVQTHVLHTLRGKPTILYEGNPQEYRQDGGYYWYATQRHGQEISLRATRGWESTGKIKALIQENRNESGETLIISGMERAWLVDPTLHSSPIEYDPERITLFLLISS